MSHPARIGYLFTQMTQNTFLAFVILNATAPLYPHYATLVRPWGMAALDDQRLAAGIMWIAGDADLPDRDPGRRLWAGCGPRRATRPGPTAGPTRSSPDPVRERRLAERLAEERGERPVGRGPAGRA